MKSTGDQRTASRWYRVVAVLSLLAAIANYLLAGGYLLGDAGRDRQGLIALVAAIGFSVAGAYNLHQGYRRSARDRERPS